MFGTNPNHMQDYAAERDALTALLTPDEINAATRNTLNAHYTDAAIVKQMWAALQALGFSTGQVLEPGSGAGTFMGFAPVGAQMVGVELDPVTAAISQYLYPDATVLNTSLQDFAVPEATFDAVIGNVPFASYAPYDRVYNPARRHSLHNYAIMKAIALTRPGGLVMVLSSSWTLDSAHDAARRAIRDKADLVGAVRLPAGAHRAAAGTEVLTDLLVFHRREVGQEPDPGGWLQTQRLGTDDQGRGITVNSYFAEHPDLVLGALAIGSGQNGRQELTVTGDLQTLPQRLGSALTGIVRAAQQQGRAYIAPSLNEPGRTVADILTTRSDLPEGHLSFNGDRFQVVRQARLADVVVPKVHAVRLRKLLELRDVAHALLEQDRATTEETSASRSLRARLNDLYDTYVAAHGPINHSRWVKSSPQDTLLERPRRNVAVDQLQPMDIIRWPGPTRGNKPRRAVVTTRGLDGSVQVAIIGATGADRQAQLTPADAPVDVLGHRTERTRLARQTPPALELDPRAAVVYALESYSAETDTATKGTLLTRRALRRRPEPGTIDNPDDALSLALDQAGHVDLVRIAALMGLDEENARARLAGRVFTDPTGGRILTREEYLSGDVRRKLREAQARLPQDPGLATNVEALTEALPEWITSDRVKATPGASWIDPDHVRAFLSDTLDDPSVKVRRFGGANWEVTSSRSGNKSDHLINVEWGTPDRSAYEIMDGLLHRTTHRITRTDPETRVTVVDADASKAANDQAEKMLGRFREWLWEDPERAEVSLQTYNDTFNALVKRSYSTRPLHPEGMTEALTLYGHQAAGVRRIVNEEGVILAHDVGAGKTFTIAAAAIELKRLGHVTKPMIVVPNHLKEQWQREFLTAFPGARLLAASTDDITVTGRAEFLAKVAAGDWDAIILTRQAFQAIPLSKDNHRAYIDRHLQKMRNLLDAARASDSSEKTVKEFERELVAREEKLLRKLDARKDDGLTFEQLGCDYLFVDEADAYKNLERLSHTAEALEGSDLAFDLDMKLGYLRQVNRSGRIVTLATATPVANSISETDTMLRYTRPDLLVAAGIDDFDTFLANFAKSEVRFEMSPTGGWVPKDRIRGFHNASGLIRLWIQTTDVMDAAGLDLDVPDVDGGRPENILAPRSEWLALEYMPRLAERAGMIRGQRRRKGADNMAVITNDGVAASLDPRMVGGPDIGQDSKLHIAASKIAEIYQETKDNRYDDPATGLEHPRPGALQFAFLDMGTPGASKRYRDRLDRAAAAAAAGDEGGPSFPVSDTRGFEAYEELKAKLITMGVPAEKVVFIHEARGKDSRKAEIFRRARNGDIAVLIGSTELMGAGTNAQDRAVAIHHIDCPYRPRDLQQRDGRIIRQKNQNGAVRVLQYATEGSLDVRKWEAVERKAGPIRALNGGNVTVDEIEEISDDVLNYAEMKAISSGNQTLLDKATTDLAYKDAAAARRNFHRAQDNAQHTVTAGAYRVTTSTQELALLDEAILRLQRLEDGNGYTAEIGSTRESFPKRADANAAIGRLVQAAYVGARGREDGEAVTVGFFGGLEVRAQSRYDAWRSITVVRLWFPDLPESQLDSIRDVEIDKANYMGRIGNHLDQLPAQRDRLAARIPEIRRNIANAEKVLGREFAGEARYRALAARSARLTALLTWEAGEARPDDPVPGHLADDSAEVIEILGALRTRNGEGTEDRPPPVSLRNLTRGGERLPRVNSWMQRRYEQELAGTSAADHGRLANSSDEGRPPGDEAKRNVRFGQRIGEVVARPTDAGLVQIFETVHGREAGATFDRILFTVQPTNDGQWAVYEATGQDPLVVLARRDLAGHWALDRAQGAESTRADRPALPSRSESSQIPGAASPIGDRTGEATTGDTNPLEDEDKPTMAPTPQAAHTDTGTRLVVEHTPTGTLVFGTTAADTDLRDGLRKAGFKWSGNLQAWYLPRTWRYETRTPRVGQLRATLTLLRRAWTLQENDDWRTHEGPTEGREANRATRIRRADSDTKVVAGDEMDEHERPQELAEHDTQGSRDQLEQPGQQPSLDVDEDPEEPELKAGTAPPEETTEPEIPAEITAPLTEETLQPEPAPSQGLAAPSPAGPADGSGAAFVPAPDDAGLPLTGSEVPATAGSLEGPPTVELPFGESPRGHAQTADAVASIDESLHRLNAELYLMRAELDGALSTVPAPSSDYKLWESCLQLIDTAYRAAEGCASELAGSSDWDRIRGIWQGARALWRTVQEAAARYGSVFTDRWGSELRALGVDAAAAISGLSDRLAGRFADHQGTAVHRAVAGLREAARAAVGRLASPVGRTPLDAGRTPEHEEIIDAFRQAEREILAQFDQLRRDTRLALDDVTSAPDLDDYSGQRVADRLGHGIVAAIREARVPRLRRPGNHGPSIADEPQLPRAGKMADERASGR